MNELQSEIWQAFEEIETIRNDAALQKSENDFQYQSKVFFKHH